MDMFIYSPGNKASIGPEIRIRLSIMGENEFLPPINVKAITSKDLSILNLSNKDPKKKPYGNEEVFGVINAYIEDKSKEDPEFRTKLDMCYTDLYSFVYKDNKNVSQEDIVFNVNRIVNNVLDLFNFYSIKDYIYNVIKDKVPDKMQQPFEDKQNDSEWNTKEQTYGTEEYIDLVALSVMFKPILPIYGLVMLMFRNRLNENAPEMIFYPSNNLEVLSLPPIVKLKSWITIHSLKDTTKRNGIAGRSTEDNVRARVLAYDLDDEEIIDYTITMLLVKYLPFRYILADADPEAKDHLASYTYGKVKRILGTDNATVNKFMERTGNKDSSIDSEDDKESTFEALRVTENISANIEIEANLFLGTSVWYVYDRLHPLIKEKIDRTILEKVSVLIQGIGPLDITKYHIHISKLCCKSYIDPRTIPYIDMNALRNVLAITFSYLWGLGYKELATLIISRTIVDSNNIDEFAIGFNQRSNVNNELIEKIVRHYPYVNFGEKRDKTAISNNYMVKYLDELYNLVLQYKWIPIPESDEFVIESYGNINYTLPLNIRIKDSLYMLAVDIEDTMLKIVNIER